MIWSLPLHLMSWAYSIWLSMLRASLYLFMMWLLTKAADWALKWRGIYYSLTISQTPSGLIGRCVTLQIYKRPKAYFKSNPRLFQVKDVGCSAMTESITWPDSWIDLHFNCWGQKHHKNKQELKTATVDVWLSVTSVLIAGSQYLKRQFFYYCSSVWSHIHKVL